MAGTLEIVERLGGPELLSERFDISLKAIKMWEQRGGIPRSRHLELLLLARERRVKLSLEELSTHSQRAA